MSAINFSTANQTFRQLLGNGLSYHVPRFQRDYSWTQDELEDLWQDIQGMLRVGGEPAHYMGYLVLRSDNAKSFEVIDGQQRLTTLSLLVLAVLKGLDELANDGVEPENNRRRADQLRASYIGYLDPVSLVASSKLKLNRNNDNYYRDYLVPLQKLPQRGLRSSEHLLRKAFEQLAKKVRDTYVVQRDGKVLASFIDELADKLFFTVITVTDELNAFKVFETLNARGVRLSATDLLKNYLFSVVDRAPSHASEIEALESRWEAMVGRLGGEHFPAFLRAHWNSRNRFVREADLFKTIRAGTPGRAQVFELLRAMDEDIRVYAALSNPDDALWTEEQRRFVRELRLFGVRQPWPLLLAAHRAYDGAGFASVLRTCSVVSFRYNVIGGLSPGEQERVYNDVARKITAGDHPTPAAAIRALAPVYVGDEAFRVAFADKVLRTTQTRNRQIGRHILFMLERQLSGQNLDVESPRYSLEHILPERADERWSQFPELKIEDATYRLGNMTLLESKPNRLLGNGGYAEKREEYAQSDFALTRKIAEDNEDWTLARIAHRQRELAKLATATWRVPQLA